MQKNKDIKDFGIRQTGMKVPDDYFDMFNARMELLLDQENRSTNRLSQPKSAKVVRFRPKIKPWIYLAAMFASCVVLFQVFMTPLTPEEPILHEAQNVEIDDSTLFMDALYASVSDYDIYEYLYAD